MGCQMTACTGGGWYWPVVEAWFLDSYSSPKLIDWRSGPSLTHSWGDCRMDRLW